MEMEMEMEMKVEMNDLLPKAILLPNGCFTVIWGNENEKVFEGNLEELLKNFSKEYLRFYKTNGVSSHGYELIPINSFN